SPGSQIACGRECVDPATDRDHCGSCGNSCDPAEQCVAGHCTCTAPAMNCGAMCLYTVQDPNFCGTSCLGLAPCQGTQYCTGGSCQCRPGLVGTGGACAEPACNPACTAPNGLCAVGIAPTCVAQCPAGTSQCGASCVNRQKDLLNCGDCGVVCDRDLVCIN